MKNTHAYDKLVGEIGKATRECRLSTPHIKYTRALHRQMGIIFLIDREASCTPRVTWTLTN